MTDVAPTALELEILGLKLAARAWGDPDGTPVLALHGWLDNCATFERLAPLLPPELRLVALDLPGHGHSDHRGADSFLHYIDWVPIVLFAADALGWQRFSFLGHSMGAGIATLCAGTEPDRIERMALIEGLGPITSPAQDAPERVARGIRELRELQQRRIVPRPYASREAAVEVRQNQRHAALERESAEVLVERGTALAEDGVRWRFDPRLRQTTMLRMTEDHVLAFISRIRCPTLLVVADDGWPVPEGPMMRRLDCLAHKRVLRLPGRHHLHLDTPDLVADDLAAFLLGRADDVGADPR